LATGKQTANIELNSPYGGALVDLIVAEDAALELRDYASHLASLRLSERAVCDLELLATGAFSPLAGFMGRADHERVLREMRLESGYIFPIPVTLPLEAGSDVRIDDDVALRDSRNELLAVMTIEEIYECDVEQIAECVFGTNDLRHPFVAEMHRWGRFNISGKLRVLQLPRHYDFRELRLSPSETRARLETLYGRNQTLELESRPERGVIVRIEIPWRSASPIETIAVSAPS